MTVVLHIVARTHVAEPSPLARDLAATPWDGKQTTTVRVLELFDPRGSAPVVDLAISERDIPEITALLHVVGEIHVHGIHPRTVMRALPAVRPAVLAGIAMTLHGPIPDARSGDPELTWPGPIADATPAPVPIDLHAPDLLPRACGPLPLVLDEGGRLAVICLGEGVPEAARAQLRYSLEALSRPEVRIEVYDECDHPLHDRAARRRCAQAVVMPASTSPRAYFEAIAQGLPVVVLGNVDAAPGVVCVGERDDVERCIACIRAWANAWAGGEAANVDAIARKRWLAERVA
jgi:hypothetical protein